MSKKEKAQRKWQLYSGVFVLLKKRLRFTARQWRSIFSSVLALWRRRLFPPLPTSVLSHC